jgi:hypothetical protein
MTMTVATDDARIRIAADYAALGRSGQILLLAKLANWLTLMARDTYGPEGGVADSYRLRAFNETQNRILAQLNRLLTEDDHRYPDDVFANILVDQFQALTLDTADIISFASESGAAAKQPRRTRRQSSPRSAAATLHRLR